MARPHRSGADISAEDAAVAIIHHLPLHLGGAHAHLPTTAVAVVTSQVEGVRLPDMMTLCKGGTSMRRHIATHTCKTGSANGTCSLKISCSGESGYPMYLRPHSRGASAKLMNVSMMHSLFWGL